jgi:DnaK suppressor protein
MTEKAQRAAGLRRILIDHRREMLAGVQGRVRDGRIDRPAEVRDLVDDSDAHVQGHIELALLQMRAEALTRIEEALWHLEAGTYGICAECESEISEGRLRALPFAVRCQACETRREQLHLRTRLRARQDDSLRGIWSPA